MNKHHTHKWHREQHVQMIYIKSKWLNGTGIHRGSLVTDRFFVVEAVFVLPFKHDYALVPLLRYLLTQDHHSCPRVAEKEDKEDEAQNKYLQ